jgi:transposase
LIEGGIPTEAMVSHVAVSRYADHQPLYRQSQMMARQGVLLDRATLASWMGYMAAEVAPVVVSKGTEVSLKVGAENSLVWRRV